MYWRLLLEPRLLLTMFSAYLLLVRALRYRTKDSWTIRFPTRASFSKMTICEAQQIINDLFTREFPTVCEKALQFALFRTYGIPTISSLLTHTSLFSDPDTASKRYADTTVLISEFIARDIGSQRWCEATSRTNCIHAPYQAGGKITNDDMLYTLALFMREPCLWIDRYEWRPTIDAEKCASGLYWEKQGEALCIGYHHLPTSAAGGKWRDGLHFYEELCEWAENYETRCMVPAQTNFETAEQTKAVLLWVIPRPFKAAAQQVIWSLMDARLRRAMLYPDPLSWVEKTVHATLRLRGFLLRNFALPRFKFNEHRVMTDEKSDHGTYYQLYYIAMPYYNKPTLTNRWGPGACIRRLQGLPVPGDQGQRFCPMGYKIPEAGPLQGRKQQKEMEEKVKQIVAREEKYFETGN